KRTQAKRRGSDCPTRGSARMREKKGNITNYRPENFRFWPGRQVDNSLCPLFPLRARMELKFPCGIPLRSLFTIMDTRKTCRERYNESQSEPEARRGSRPLEIVSPFAGLGFKFDRDHAMKSFALFLSAALVLGLAGCTDLSQGNL